VPKPALIETGENILLDFNIGGKKTLQCYTYGEHRLIWKTFYFPIQWCEEQKDYVPA